MHSFIILLSVIIVVIDISIRAYLYIQCKVLLNKLRKAISTGSLFSLIQKCHIKLMSVHHCLHLDHWC